MTSSVPWSRRDVALLLVLILALGLTWVPRTRGPLDLRWDAAAYFILGTSLAQGNGYRFSNEPGNLQAVVWPPALPAIIAVHELLLGSADPIAVGRWLRLSFFVMWIVYIAGAYVLFRLFEGRTLAAAGTALTALHMSTIWLSDRSYADLPFALAVVAFVVVATRRRQDADGLTWFVASCAYLLRTAGLALLFAWIADAVIERRPKAVVLRIALAVLPILGWQGWIAYVEQTAIESTYPYARADYELYNVSYARNMMLRDPNDPGQGRLTVAELPGRAAVNLRTTPIHLGEAVSLLERDWATIMTAIKQRPVLGSIVPWRIIRLSLAFFGACVALGALVCLVRGPRIVALVLAGYLALLALLPTDYHWPRYLAGIAPVVLMCFLAAVSTVASVASGFRPRWIHVAGRAFAVATTASAVVLQIVCATWYYANDLRPVRHLWNGRDVQYQLFTYDDAFRSFDTALEWIAAHGSRGDIVMSSMPHWVYLRTHLRSVMPPFESDAAIERDLMKSVGARFVVIDRSGFSSSQHYAAPVVAKYSSEWRLVYRDPAGLAEVYEIAAGANGT